MMSRLKIGVLVGSKRVNFWLFFLDGNSSRKADSALFGPKKVPFLARWAQTRRSVGLPQKTLRFYGPLRDFGGQKGPKKGLFATF